MAIDGHRSVFPLNIDDWGSEFVNNICQIVNASDFNKMEDALYRIEIKTRRTFITGQTGVLQPAVSGSARPHMMFKAFTVAATGSSTTTKNLVIPGPAFSATEKTLFGGSPLASGNLVHIQVRKASGDSTSSRSYHGGLVLPADKSGDSGFTVVASTARHGNGDTTIDAGTYVVSVMITNH